MITKPDPKPYILGLQAYKPGKASAGNGRALIKLSANENPLGTSAAAMEALTQPRDQAALYADPACTKLRETLAKVHALDPAQIVCGTGSGELLHCAVQAFAGAGDEVLFSQFSFSLYPLIAHKVGATPVFAPDNDFGANVDALLASATERTKVVLLDNPNNPCASWVAPEEVRRLHSGLPGNVLLVLDEAYAEYLAPEYQRTGFDLASKHANVLVTRTFSKAYGLAAERIGWAYGAPPLIDYINRLRGAFNVSMSGQSSAVAALGDQHFVEASRQHNSKERTRFEAAIAQLGNHGLRAVPSAANFSLVLFEGDVKAETALQALAKKGYAVRHLPGQGLPDALRITIGKSEDMDRVIAALRQLCGETA